ncbi:putative transcription factor VIP1-like [Capsicum annuum]|nr:putative transcription factor VIP1-like [Capsicum annuum]
MLEHFKGISNLCVMPLKCTQDDGAFQSHTKAVIYSPKMRPRCVQDAGAFQRHIKPVWMENTPFYKVITFSSEPLAVIPVLQNYVASARQDSPVLRYRFQISSSISVSSESSSFEDMIVMDVKRYSLSSYHLCLLYLNVDPDQHVECWYKKETFLKSYSHFIQPITNMRMWPKTKNPSIESPKPRKMPDRPGKNRRKKKDKPKKWGKLSKKVSRSLVQGASKLAITRLMGWGSSNSSQPSCQPEASWNPPPPQSRSICGDTSAMARHTYAQSQTTRSSSTFHTYATTQSSQSGSICADTAAITRAPQRKVSSAAGRGKGAAGRGKGCSGKDGGSGSGQFGADRGGERGIGRGRGVAGIGKGFSGMDDGSGSRQFGADRGDEGGIGKGQGGSGRGLPRKIANVRGTPFKSGRNVSSSQVPPLPTRSYNATSFATATGYKRPATGFGVYYNPATRINVYNPGTSSERVLYGGINLRSASPTNIDIGFKPSGLKWNGKDAVTSTQLQQMKANNGKKLEAAKSSLSIRSSKK